MKGITPIISTIILLLIAIALAGTAYVYLSGFIGPMTSKDLMIITGSETCTAGSNIKMRILNTGTTTLKDSDIINLMIDNSNIGFTLTTFIAKSGENVEITLGACTACTAGSHIVKLSTLSAVRQARVIC